MRRASGTRKAGEIWLGTEGEASLRGLLLAAREMRATDLHILAGSPVYGRVDGALRELTDHAITASTARHLAFGMLSEQQRSSIGEALDLDVMVVDDDQHRYRLNVGYANGSIGAVIRLLPRRPVPLETLQLPPIVEATTHRGKGLVLITGSTSQGKTTTMASMVDAINRHSRKHIVTIEDPIEYVHEPAQSLIRQREVGRDTKSFASGLRAALRQDPDVVLIGEMRDYDTIEIALRAAASGMLVISTLHIVSVERLMDRLLSYAPPGREPLIRTMASEVLHLVVHQELLPTTDGAKRVAAEVVVGSRAVRNMLKTGTESQLRQAILSGRESGMVMMQQSLDGLLEAGTIAEDVHRSVSRNYAAIT